MTGTSSCSLPSSASTPNPMQKLDILLDELEALSLRKPCDDSTTPENDEEQQERRNSEEVDAFWGDVRAQLWIDEEEIYWRQTPQATSQVQAEDPELSLDGLEESIPRDLESEPAPLAAVEIDHKIALKPFVLLPAPKRIPPPPPPPPSTPMPQREDGNLLTPLLPQYSRNQGLVDPSSRSLSGLASNSMAVTSEHLSAFESPLPVPRLWSVPSPKDRAHSPSSEIRALHPPPGGVAAASNLDDIHYSYKVAEIPNRYDQQERQTGQRVIDETQPKHYMRETEEKRQRSVRSQQTVRNLLTKQHELDTTWEQKRPQYRHGAQKTSSPRQRQDYKQPVNDENHRVTVWPSMLPPDHTSLCTPQLPELGRKQPQGNHGFDSLAIANTDTANSMPKISLSSDSDSLSQRTKPGFSLHRRMTTEEKISEIDHLLGPLNSNGEPMGDPSRDSKGSMRKQLTAFLHGRWSGSGHRNSSSGEEEGDPEKHRHHRGMPFFSHRQPQLQTPLATTASSSPFPHSPSRIRKLADAFIPPGS
ncbi:hypothetical protein B0T19DRAFT_422906 [Cercophora scortea]|uniref:Uncharacterized protein n=1 Tax=Cercophora scortea TaxID=314031 RepID=A0AAE0IMT2_9PEZI|nr:hypothetical protein B0T19DRAFT_422906 [Cercophora scortea]